jgi:hypothetical protein
MRKAGSRYRPSSETAPATIGRSTRDVLNLVHELDQKGAFLHILEPAISTDGPMGKMVLTVLGMVGEMELGFIKAWLPVSHTILIKN